MLCAAGASFSPTAMFLVISPPLRVSLDNRQETGISSVAAASLDTRAGRLPESLGQGCDTWIPSSLGLPVSDPFPLVPAADPLSYKHRL